VLFVAHVLEHLERDRAVDRRGFQRDVEAIVAHTPRGTSEIEESGSEF